MQNKGKITGKILLWLIVLAGLFLRLKNIAVPAKIYFDEIYYVNAAKDYLKFVPDTNWVHPPLGKMIMALGILAVGDYSVGWRIMGALIGTAMIIILYVLAKKIFKSEFTGLSCAFLFAICPFNIAQSRIATLDIYLSFFVLLGFYFLYLYIDSEKKPAMFLLLSSVSFGLSCACKYSGIFGVIAAVIILVFYGRFNKNNPVETTHRVVSHRVVSRRGIFAALFLFIIIIPLVYLTTYIPFFLLHQGFNKLIALHIDFLKFHYEPGFKHPYLSEVWTWPLMIRPIWYYFDMSKVKIVTGIISMGNPFIWWSFLIFYVCLIINFLKTKNSKLFFILIGYLCLYALWFISLKGGFFYYMQPASIFMYLTIVCFLNLWWKGNNKILAVLYLAAAGVFFAVFLPIVIAVPITSTHFYKLMWLKSWI